MSASAHNGPDQSPPSDPGRSSPDPCDGDMDIPVQLPETDEDTTDPFVLYDYSTPAYRIRSTAIQAAEIELASLAEDADTDGEDMTGTPFCGCYTCGERLSAAFWISWTIDAIASGDLVVEPAAPSPT